MELDKLCQMMVFYIGKSSKFVICAQFEMKMKLQQHSVRSVAAVQFYARR